MAWKASGDERAKSYRVYKALEAEAERLRAQVGELTDQLRAKNATIRQLSAELALALPESSPVTEVEPAVGPFPDQPTSAPSPTLEPRPGLAKASPGLSLRDRLEQAVQKQKGRS